MVPQNYFSSACRIILLLKMLAELENFGGCLFACACMLGFQLWYISVNCSLFARLRFVNRAHRGKYCARMLANARKDLLIFILLCLKILIMVIEFTLPLA